MPEPTSPSPGFPLTVVTGVGHSGTTFFGTLLNSHPDLHCVGELARIQIALERDMPCSCGTLNAECEFWKPMLPVLKGKRDYDWRDLTPEMYERVRQHAGSKGLVDLSKTLPWRMARPLGSPWRKADVGYIWLVRDSRGVLASPHRKGRPVLSVLARHRKWIKRIEKFMASQGERGITLFYEDLCQDPERELKRICKWLSIEYDKAMLRPAEQAHHFTHANRLAYLGRGNKIRHDERWRKELSPELIAEIEDSMRRVPFLRDRYLTPSSSAPSVSGPAD